MDSKDLIEMLEMRTADMKCRELQPEPEKNRNLKMLVNMMSLTYSNWNTTDFKAVPKDLKW